MFSDNSNRFKYEAFGLKIYSEIYLPELIPSKFKIADLTITLGEVDHFSGKTLDDGFSFRVTENAIYRFWDMIGKFKIIDGSKIIVDPAPEIEETTLRNFLLGTVFATLLRQRGLFVLHASSVNINGHAVAFSGFKGYGKSTTAVAFYNEGYPIVSDDYIAIKFDNNKPLISPGFPSLRLSNESRKAIGFDKFNSDNKTDKKYASVPKSFSRDIIPLKKVYILQRSEKSRIIHLNPQKAFMELIKNTFGIYMFSKSELPDNFFQCERLLKQVDVSILEIPDTIERIPEIVRIVQEDDIKFFQ
jgi:hypothetical protein